MEPPYIVLAHPHTFSCLQSKSVPLKLEKWFYRVETFDEFVEDLIRYNLIRNKPLLVDQRPPQIISLGCISRRTNHAFVATSTKCAEREGLKVPSLNTTLASVVFVFNSR